MENTNRNANVNELKKSNKLMKVAIIMWGCIISILVITFIIWQFTKPKPDTKAFSAAINYYISNNKDIIGFDYIENDIYKLTINDSWYGSSEVQKIKYCNDVREVFTAYAWQNNIISKDKLVYIYFYDKNGIKIAEPSLGLNDYTILH